MDKKKLASKFKALELESFGENALTEKMYLGIAKLAITQDRVDDLDWIKRQLEVNRKNLEQMLGGKGYTIE